MVSKTLKKTIVIQVILPWLCASCLCVYPNKMLSSTEVDHVMVIKHEAITWFIAPEIMSVVQHYSFPHLKPYLVIAQYIRSTRKYRLMSHKRRLRDRIILMDNLTQILSNWLLWGDFDSWVWNVNVTRPALRGYLPTFWPEDVSQTVISSRECPLSWPLMIVIDGSVTKMNISLLCEYIRHKESRVGLVQIAYRLRNSHWIQLICVSLETNTIQIQNRRYDFSIFDIVLLRPAKLT